MKVYADTNILTNSFLVLTHFEEARYLLSSLSKDSHIPVTPLLRVEFANALERLVFESRHGGQHRVTSEYAASGHAAFEVALAGQLSLKAVVLDEEAVMQRATQIILRHTAKHGFRTYDILHVASALELGCDTFWSFDKRALHLAKLEGLKTNHAPAAA